MSEDFDYFRGSPDFAVDWRDSFNNGVDRTRVVQNYRLPGPMVLISKHVSSRAAQIEGRGGRSYGFLLRFSARRSSIRSC